jgi:hypothetical protein
MFGKQDQTDLALLKRARVINTILLLLVLALICLLQQDKIIYIIKNFI